MGQRVRRLSSPSGEEQGEGGAGQEERGGETEGEKREERRRQAQLLQIHRELQNVEVTVGFLSLLCLLIEMITVCVIHVKLNVTHWKSVGFVANLYLSNQLSILQRQ